MITMEQITNANKEELHALLEENHREFDEIHQALIRAISGLSGTDMDEFGWRAVRIEEMEKDLERNGREARAIIRRMNVLGSLRDQG